MKTAMQKFISGIDAYETDETLTILDRMKRAENFIEVLRKRAHLLLEAEKEQIMEAYKNGFKDAQRPFIPTWEQYYQQTYNPECEERIIELEGEIYREGITGVFDVLPTDRIKTDL